MALGETHIIQETKQYLEEEGVRLEAFEGKRKRSKTVIIVKNIPFEISEDDLREVFGKYGSLGRVSGSVSLMRYVGAREYVVALVAALTLFSASNCLGNTLRRFDATQSHPPEFADASLPVIWLTGVSLPVLHADHSPAHADHRAGGVP